jgi:cytidylate kinase
MMYLHLTRPLHSTGDSTVSRKMAQVNQYITIITSKAHRITTTIIMRLAVPRKVPYLQSKF